MAEAVSTANPAGAAAIAADTTFAADIDSVDVEAGLKAGTISVEEGFGLMQQQMAQQKKQIATMEQQLVGASGGASRSIDALVRKALGHRAEAPTNQHQVAVFCAASDDPELVGLLPRMLLWSFLLVLFQSMAAVGVFVGTFRPACQTSDQCFEGGFCNVDSGRCDYCSGEYGPLAMETEGTCVIGEKLQNFLTTKSEDCATYNWPYDENFAGFNTTAVRLVCADPTGPLNYRPYSSDHVRSWCDSW